MYNHKNNTITKTTTTTAAAAAAPTTDTIPEVRLEMMALGKNHIRLQQRLRCLIFGLAFVLFAGIVFGIHWLGTSPLFNQYEIVRNYQSSSSDGSVPRMADALRPSVTPTILLWSSFFGDARWKLPKDTLGVDHFRDELLCPVYQCMLTNRHDFLPALELYAAIVYHAAEPFPIWRALPRVRSTHQAYVFALMEPPGETKHRLGDEQNFYNLTMSYRLDSDIVWPYMHVFDIETGAVVAPTRQPHWRQPPSTWNDTDIWTRWPGKVKMAAWFVSHCDTLSLREQLVAALQKYIDVDIYGKCGTWTCERDSVECDNLLDADYKFYFSFENSLCTDYVTEKLYMALQRQIIPVVYGGADFRRFLPPLSYIDAEQFASVAELADYLKFVASDVNEYMRYFWWRPYYRLGYISPFCALCEQLHSATWQQKTQAYTNIEEWWLGGSCRFEPKISLE